MPAKFVESVLRSQDLGNAFSLTFIVKTILGTIGEYNRLDHLISESL